MYKNTHFLSVKFIITYSQIYSLSECFAAKEVEKRQNYYQRCRFPGNLCSAGSFREAFYRDFPPQKVRKTIRQWETTSAPQTSCPQGNPSSPRVRTQDVGECRNGRRMYAAMSHRRCFLARLWRCTKALPCHTARHHSRVGHGFLRWSTLLSRVFPHPAGVMPFSNGEMKLHAGGFAPDLMKIKHDLGIFV